MYTAARNPVNRNDHFQQSLKIDCGTRDISEILQPRRSMAFSRFLSIESFRVSPKNRFQTKTKRHSAPERKTLEE